MILDPDVIKKAKEHALKEFPKESCGIVRDSTYIPCNNIADDPLSNFEISPRKYLAESKKGKIEAVLHSHPKGKIEPSGNDMRGQVSTDVPWGIIVCNETHAKDPVMWGDFILDKPLLQREFIHGIQDCYTAIRSWYWQERGVRIKEFPRDNEWWDKEDDLYVKGFEEAGFRRISKDELQLGDVVMLKIRSPQINHAGVYLGNGLVYHHLPNRLSCRDSLPRWMSKMELFVRYDA